MRHSLCSTTVTNIFTLKTARGSHAEEHSRLQVLAGQRVDPTWREATHVCDGLGADECVLSLSLRGLVLADDCAHLPYTVKTREGCLPVPELDEIIGAFFAFQSDGEAPENCYVPGTVIGMVLVDPKAEGEISRKDPRRLLKEDVAPTLVKSELDLINTIVERVWEWDPDILSGWEVQTASWGYVTHRMGTYAAADGTIILLSLLPLPRPPRS